MVLSFAKKTYQDEIHTFFSTQAREREIHGAALAGDCYPLSKPVKNNNTGTWITNNTHGCYSLSNPLVLFRAIPSKDHSLLLRQKWLKEVSPSVASL